MKKKIWSVICTLCLILPCAIIFSACKSDKIKSYNFYLDGTIVSNSSLSLTYGETFNEDFEDVTLTVTTTKETLNFKLSEINYTLTYNDFSETTTLEALPTEWNAGIYTFTCTVSTSCGDVSASLVVNVAEIDYGTTYLFQYGDSQTEFTFEYDNSQMTGNDPAQEIYVDEDLADVEFKTYYITAAQYQAYQALSSDADKLAYLKANKIEYSGSYQIPPATYYMFAVVETPQNYKNYYTNLVRCIITNTTKDYSMINLQMDYTFNTQTCTEGYVTFAQIIEEIGMIEFDNEFEGTVAWKEDYSAMQISYSDTPVILKLVITPNNPYITINKTEFDVTLNLHKGLIQVPTLKEPLNFVYNEAEQGISLETANNHFDNWFSQNDLSVINGAFDLHTNVGNYALELELVDTTNFAFTADGENAIDDTAITFDWTITKAHHHCNVNGIEPTPIHAVDNETTIEATITLPANGKIALPTLSKFYNTPFCATEPSYDIVIDGTTATAEIVDSEIVVSNAGTIILTISHAGNENIHAIEITVILTVSD